MNERIRELAGQAGFETEHHKWIFANDNAGEGECHELLEKFAKLLIKECAKRIDYWESRQGEHCDDLLKHFGVDE